MCLAGIILFQLILTHNMEWLIVYGTIYVYGTGTYILHRMINWEYKLYFYIYLFLTRCGYLWQLGYAVFLTSVLLAEAFDKQRWLKAEDIDSDFQAFLDETSKGFIICVFFWGVAMTLWVVFGVLWGCLGWRMLWNINSLDSDARVKFRLKKRSKVSFMKIKIIRGKMERGSARARKFCGLILPEKARGRLQALVTERSRQKKSLSNDLSGKMPSNLISLKKKRHLRQVRNPKGQVSKLR
jgi:hypothetical protein